MINLEIKQKIIIKSENEGKSERQISYELDISRNTVRKYLKEYREAKQKLMEEGAEVNREELIEEIIKKPKYDSSNRKKVKVTEEIEEKINEYLKNNEIKRNNGQHKQQMKIIDMHEDLEEKGYEISYTSVRNTVREIEKVNKESYIKQEYTPGEIVEFDWGEVKIFEEDKLKTFQIAVFTFAKSNYHYAILFPKQNTECFLESHALFYEHIGKINTIMVYDNMKVAVKKLVGTSKEATDALLKLSIYYGFDYRFCNARKPNEKGHVERGVEYIRRKVFSKKDVFKSLKEANEHLLKKLEKINSKKRVYANNKSPKELLEEELMYMKAKPPKFETAVIKDCVVNKYSTITIDSCYYSVPEKFTGRLIKVKLYTDKIIMYSNEEKIGYHERIYGLNKWSVKLEHYLKTLIKKPGALAGSTALHQAHEKIQVLYKDYFSTKPKDFILLINYMYEKNITIEKIEKAIKELIKISPKDISLDKIKLIIEKKEAIKTDKENEIQAISRKQLLILSEMMA